MEPWLTDVELTLLPRPWLKWAYEPARAEDIPAVFMCAVAIALQPPSGPVFLSFPLGDWEVRCESPAVVRTVSQRIASDSSRLTEFAKMERQYAISEQGVADRSLSDFCRIVGDMQQVQSDSGHCRRPPRLRTASPLEQHPQSCG
jgi:hypothetical protein